MKSVLIIPDLHFPFHHSDTFDFLKALKKKYRPHQVVCLGDEVDFHTISRWIADPDGYSSGHELSMALNALSILYDIFPVVKTCTSNHTSRPFKAASEARIPQHMIKSYKDMLCAPSGWQWADRWVFDSVVYEHGEGCSGEGGALKAAKQNMMSTVIGHIHSFAGITYLASNDRLIFGFNAGCLIDRSKYAFAYGAKIRNKPILGAGIIENGVPQFIPMLLDKRGQWTGKL